MIEKQFQSTFNINEIINSIQNEDDITVKQLNNQIKQLRITLKDIVKDIMKLQKNIQQKPNTTLLTENTILVNTSIQPDPAILKMITTKQSFNNDLENQDQKDDHETLNQSKKLKNVSLELGKKLCQISDGMPVLLTMIKGLEKQKNAEISELKNLMNEKLNNLQEQISELKDEEITQRLLINQKVQNQNIELNQKLRFIESNQVYQFAQIKKKMSQKIEKKQLETKLQKIINELKVNITKFQEQSESLVNPQKIKQLQSLINQKSSQLTKQMISCEIKIEKLKQKINNQVVPLDYYKKQRTNLEKRMSITNSNFEQFFKKVQGLIKSQQNHENRLKKLQKQNNTQNDLIQNLQKVLTNLNITEDFQKMLANINPQQILKLQNNIQELKLDNLNIYKQLGNMNREVDKLSSKFQISGVLIPNKSRQKQFYLDDLKQIIDEYFKENRYANKISKLENQINQNKVVIESIKNIEKKIARLQKESQYSHIVGEFRKLEEYTKKQLTVFEQKISQNIAENQVSLSFMKGLKRIDSKLQNQDVNNLRRVSLISEESQRASRILKSNSLRNVVNLDTVKKEMNQTFTKNTISSSRKNLLKSHGLLFG